MTKKDKEKTEYKKIINRLSRVEGQVRGLKKMLNDEKKQDCKKFITQVKAARNALKNISKEYVANHIHACQTHSKKTREKEIDEAIKLLISD